MYDAFEIMKARHSVRRYLTDKIDEEKAILLQNEIDRINAESGLYFVLCLDNTEVFRENRLNYGSFSGCGNFFILYGKKKDEEKIGYYGERLVLFAQSIGLNTCWVALTYAKNKIPVETPEGMKLHDVIALGYGATQGHPHKSKPAEKLSNIDENSPEWFKMGIEASMLAPTAINQQKFYFELIGEKSVRAKALIGPCSKTDLGIVKYHFELGAGKDSFEWIE